MSLRIVADASIPFINDYFSSYGQLILKPGRTISPQDVAQADILLVRSITRVNAELLAHSSVKFVGSITSGMDHVDTEWLSQHHIKWCAATGFNARAVADYVTSCLATFSEQANLKRRLTAVVIGVGNVGKLVAERFKFLNYDVLLCDPLRAASEKNFSSIDLHAINNVDVISLHVPLTLFGKHATYHFIDAAFLNRQKENCLLINASRGAVIDSQAMLSSGKHLHYCLDVWENEPHIDKAVLHQTFIATPHMAGYSIQSKLRGIDMIYHELVAQDMLAPLGKKPHPYATKNLDCSTAKNWQDVVLKVFNPRATSELLKEKLSPTQDGKLFDELRQQFITRFEFAYLTLLNADLPVRDKEILENLGFK